MHVAKELSTSRSLPRWVRIINLLSTVIVVPAALACLAMMLHVIADVVGRTFFNRPLPGTLEITQYWWMMAIVFGAFGYAQVRGDHIRATIVPELMGPRGQRGAEILAVALLAVLGVFVAYYGWHAALASREIREVSNSSPPVPIWPLVFLVPFGAISLTLQCIASIYELAVGRDLDSHAEELI